MSSMVGINFSEGDLDWIRQHRLHIVAAGCVAWYILFAIMERFVRAVTDGSVKDAKPSTPGGEKPTTVQGFAFLIISTIHSGTVAFLVLLCVPQVLFADRPGDTINDQLRVDAVGGQELNLMFVAGHLYLAWVVFEVIFFTVWWRTFGKVSDMFHHVLFSVTGLYFVMNERPCGYYALVLMSMEASTPWLNLHLAFRGSDGSYRRLLGKAAGIVYFVTMAVFRVAIPSAVFFEYVTAVASFPSSLQDILSSEFGTQFAVIAVVQVLSFCLQTFWFLAILAKIVGTAGPGKRERIAEKRKNAAAGAAQGNDTDKTK